MCAVAVGLRLSDCYNIAWRPGVNGMGIWVGHMGSRSVMCESERWQRSKTRMDGGGGCGERTTTTQNRTRNGRQSSVAETREKR